MQTLASERGLGVLALQLDEHLCHYELQPRFVPKAVSKMLHRLPGSYVTFTLTCPGDLLAELEEGRSGTFSRGYTRGKRQDAAKQPIAKPPPISGVSAKSKSKRPRWTWQHLRRTNPR